MFVENILGSKTKVKLLRVLSEARTAYTLKSLRDETCLSLSIAHKAAEELVREGLLLRIKGNRKERMYKFNTDSPFAPSVFDLFRVEKTRQRKEIIFLRTWSILEAVVSKVKSESNLIILFGSQARGDAILDSDVDLLIVPKSQNKILDSLREVEVKNKLNPMLLDLAIFKEHIKGNTLFYRNLKKDSVVLYINPKIKVEIEKFLEDIQYSG